ncbi:isoeugenol synthase 1-like isoform X1 [Macadamia integrifolia]|uniref:isoeugenol synthase 1-like isoform X1 n=1 Tax=Macadamia integrifolia TaxID=60698 RepID=UPI001C4E3B27|nr:isoeugenol synthase 1-like isoform X1 [Macadamia integrifolia]
MMMADKEESKSCRILVIGATGYVGKYMVKASICLGYPTFVYVRPLSSTSSSSKQEAHGGFQSMGVTIFQGELDEHEKLVSSFQQVDVVISTLPVPQHLDQLKIIKAMKEAGNIKRFLPSEFGHEVDRGTALPPFQRLLDDKKKIRRATEEAGISYTYVAANTLAAYFIDLLLHPHDQLREEVIVYGNGEAKVVLNFEEDVCIYTIKASVDPRTVNKVIILRPPGNIISQLDLIALWENKSQRKLKKVQIPEEEIVKHSEVLPHPDNIRISIVHNIFIKGEQVRFELGEDDLEASHLYPDHQYMSVDRLLDVCVVDAPIPKLTVF